MVEERKYWDEEVETMPLDKLKKLQGERLQEIVTWAYERSKFYRQKFDEAGVKPSDISTVDDLAKLPLIVDDDIRHAPIEDKLSVPWEEVHQYCSSTGTTGFPEPILFTRSDYDIGCIDGVCRLYWTAGVRPSDVVQSLLGVPCHFVAPRALGARSVGEQVGRGGLDHRVVLAKMMHVTVLVHFPSLALQYFARARELGIDTRETELRLLVGIGEGWAESYTRKVEADYGVTFRGFFGVATAGEIASGCGYGGMHIVGDRHVLEIIDPETKQVLPPGEEGELVVTNLIRRAIPKIRIREGDISRILPHEPCPCGRTHPKLSMIRGRMSQLINVKGKRFFPVDIEEVLGGIPDLGYEWQIIRDKPVLDRLMVKVEHKPEVKDLGALANRVEEALFDGLGVESEAELVPPGSIGHPLVKAMRVITTYEKT